ncbi:MAG: ankyrin repeat domain-containing protein, partial [Pirellulales bacterium]
MKARKKGTEKEQVLVRHVTAEKRNDIQHIEPLLKAPFPSDSSSTSDGRSKDVSILGYASGRCLVAARFAKQPWAPLYSNAASAQELFEANAGSRRLEVVWLGCKPDVGWFFRLNRAGKTVVDFAQPLDADSPARSKLSGVEPSVLKQGESGEQAVARLAKHFKITRSMPEVRISDDGFQVLDADGRPRTSGLRGYLRLDGPGVADGDSGASIALEEAIESCDAEGIREAIAQGASLTVLPDSCMPPLLAALYKFEEPDWKECVELLIELGCPVNGVKNDPPIIYCVGEDFAVPEALEAVELLLAHGADVNATNFHGHTALFRCVVENRVDLVRFLLEHGADPNAKGPNFDSPVEWLRKASGGGLNFDFDKRTRYAELLSLLTGEPVSKPQPTTVGPALAAESARFRTCVTALRLVPMLDANVSIQTLGDSPYTKRRWYRDWQKELVDGDFEFVQHFDVGLADYSAFTNADLGFDALLSEGDRPGCEVIAYHNDRTTTTVASFAEMIGPEFAPQSRVFEAIKGASPVQLVERLKELVRGKRMMRVDASSFASRYTEAVNRVSHEVGERALSVLKTPTVLINGSPPRYERLGCYLDFVGAGWKDPGFSTANWVQDWQDEFAKADDNPPHRTGGALDAAMKLVAASHFQFASSPDANELLAPASDVALAHFQALAGAGKNETEAAPWFQFRALLRGLSLCALAGRWETFEDVCNLVQPKLASANTADEENLDFAQVLLVLVSSYRKRPLPKAAALEQAVAKRLAKIPRLLLDVWRAIGAGRANDVEKALRTSLEYFMELRGDKLVP